MDPITWATLLPVILRDGIPAAMRLWQMLQSNEPVTQDKWDELARLSQKTYDDYIAEAQARAGGVTAPTSPPGGGQG